MYSLAVKEPSTFLLSSWDEPTETVLSNYGFIFTTVSGVISLPSCLSAPVSISDKAILSYSFYLDYFFMPKNGDFGEGSDSSN